MQWSVVETVPALAAGEVQLWRARVSSEAVAAAVHQLQPVERERMDRMRAVTARDEFVVGRALLRRLLGHDVGLQISEGGKPFVEGLEFNVAHSHGMIVIALCRDSIVGVDIEVIDPAVETAEIGEKHFAPVEHVRMATSPDPVREFFQIWAKKEAILKAHGGGLVAGLDRFATPAGDGQVSFDGRTYWLTELDVAEGYSAALATAATDFLVRGYEPADLTRFLRS